MRFNIGPVPDEFTPDRSWRPIREPNPVVMQFFALPTGLGMALAIGYGWYRVGMPTPMQSDARYTGIFLLGR